MKINSVKIIAAAALLSAALLPIAAQAQGVNERFQDQHQRIRQGVRSGQITRGEQYRLNRRDAYIHGQERLDRRFNNGHLTYGERRNLNNELNHSSGAIYRNKHNAYTR